MKRVEYIEGIKIVRQGTEDGEQGLNQYYFPKGMTWGQVDVECARRGIDIHDNPTYQMGEVQWYVKRRETTTHKVHEVNYLANC